MIESLVSVVGQRGVDAAAFLLAFALTALTDSLFHNKLPHDHGREFAVNGGLSKGKARGSGLIFVLCIALVSLAFLPFRVEYVIYTVLLIASMLSGYFDDAAEKAWNEYKKGIIDFVIAVVAGVTYLNFNGCGVQFLQWSFTLPYAVYLLLIVILIWGQHQRGQLHRRCGRPVRQSGGGDHRHLPDRLPRRSWPTTAPPVWCSWVRCWLTCGPTQSPAPC